MSLSLEEVRRIARLARMEISPTETATTRDQLNGIFAFIEQLRAVDTGGIEPMSHAVDFQKVAPAVEAGLYLVPKVIE